MGMSGRQQSTVEQVVGAANIALGKPLLKSET